MPQAGAPGSWAGPSPTLRITTPPCKCPWTVGSGRADVVSWEPPGLRCGPPSKSLRRASELGQGRCRGQWAEAPRGPGLVCTVAGPLDSCTARVDAEPVTSRRLGATRGGDVSCPFTRAAPSCGRPAGRCWSLGTCLRFFASGDERF